MVGTPSRWSGRARSAWNRSTAIAVATVAAALAIAAPAAIGAPAVLAAPTATVTSTHYSGTLMDGSIWVADVPSNWNGTLLDFSHGLVGANVAVDADSPGSRKALLAAGYALTGASFDPSGPLWPFDGAIQDSFSTIQAVENSVLPSAPTNVIAVGESMGGLISALMDERSDGRLTGALNLCPLVAGGESFENYMLDGSYALNELLAPTQDVQLTGYTTEDEAKAAGHQLMQIAEAGQTTAAGRARLALASALYNVTTWTAINVGGIDTNPKVHSPIGPPPLTDYAQWEDEQYETQYAPGSIVLPYGEENRYYIEQAVGGQPAWDTVNYTTVIDDSPYYPEIAALYSAAGLDLASDLQTLTANADITANSNALSNLAATAVPTGHLEVPELDLHTIADELVPIQQENAYAQVVDAAGDGSDLGQAYIYRQGHCNFNAGEEVTSVNALMQRISSGSWGTSLTPSSMNQYAATLKDGPGSFISYAPPALTGSNLPAPSSSFASSAVVAARRSRRPLKR
jgi:hypothetical protein